MCSLTSNSKKLCGFKNCEKCFNKSFASFDGITESGKKKVDCWDYEKNDKNPCEVNKHKNNKFWFKCDNCPHSFNSILNNITGKNRWCPYCCNPPQKMCKNNEDKHCITCYNKSFASFDGITESGKKKVDCWDYEKNDKNPWGVSRGTDNKYFFRCDSCFHSFDSQLDSITCKNRWCSYCANKKMCENNEDKHCITCYNKSFASFDELTINGKKKVDCWDYEKNDKNPWEVTKKTHSKFWFKCDNCHHSFNSVLSSITNGCWCPYCCNPPQKMCENNEDKHCITCYNKSFASLQDLTPTENSTTKKVDCWHPTQNGDIKTCDLFKVSGKKYSFKCDNCPHSFDITLDNLTCGNGWCPYCCKSSKKFCDKYKKDYNNCLHCFNKSFASFDGLTINGKKKIECWHPTENGDIKPCDLLKYNNSKFWFKCDNCPHSFYSALSHVADLRWCSYCCNPPKKMCKNNEDKHCITCYNKSFASFDGLTINGKKKVECWHLTENGDIKPCDLFKCSSTGKFCFTCDECNNNFHSQLDSITRMNSWCPHCKNKTELKLHKWLQILEEIYPNYTIIITKEDKKKWCRNPDPNYKKKKEPCYYPYDFNIQIKELKLNIIIELDGRQHFEYISHFDNNVEERQIIDLYKMFQAFKNNHSFIRIFQEDVYYDNNDWENKLKHCIDKIIKSNHIMSLYVDNGNKYDIYRTRDPYKILKFKEVISQIKNH